MFDGLTATAKFSKHQELTGMRIAAASVEGARLANGNALVLRAVLLALFGSNRCPAESDHFGCSRASSACTLLLVWLYVAAVFCVAPYSCSSLTVKRMRCWAHSGPLSKNIIQSDAAAIVTQKAASDASRRLVRASTHATAEPIRAHTSTRQHAHRRARIHHAHGPHPAAHATREVRKTRRHSASARDPRRPPLPAG